MISEERVKEKRDSAVVQEEGRYLFLEFFQEIRKLQTTDGLQWKVPQISER
jgi:hypothetical protein